METHTKAKQVEQILRSAIRRREWKCGERMPSEKELGERLGVNRSTLRDALNTLACDGLVVRRSGSGTYVGDGIKVNSIAIIEDACGFASPIGYWYRSLIDAAAGNVRDSGHNPMILLGHGNSQDEFDRSLYSVLEPIQAGVARVLSLTTLESLAARLMDWDIPYASIEMGEHTGRYSTVLDYARLLCDGRDLMMAHGHSDFTIMYLAPAKTEIAKMYAHWSSHLYRMAVNFDTERLFAVPHSWDGIPAYESFIEWWNGPNRTSSVFITDDGIFDAASRAILELGIRVPEDLAILTHANAGRRFVFPISVASLGWDPGIVMNLAWGMLSDQISGRETQEPVVYVPPVFQEGATLG